MHSRKTLKVLLMVTLMMGSFACSMRSKKTIAKEEAAAKEETVANEEAAKLEGEEILADDLFQKSKQEGADQNIAQNESASPAITEQPTAPVETAAVAAATSEPVEEKVVHEEPKVDHTAVLEEKQYVVQKNETLMMVAFKLFGDYSKWRELSEKNNLNPNKKIVPGTVINYAQNGDGFVWTPRGNPYLIKLGQTLGLISSDVYGTNKQWKQIWDNNRPMIKNPNLIFAGFTIYYIPKDDLAVK